MNIYISWDGSKPINYAHVPTVTRLPNVTDLGVSKLLQEFAQDLVCVDGLLRQPVVALVVLLLSSAFGARGPLQEVLLGPASHLHKSWEFLES